MKSCQKQLIVCGGVHPAPPVYANYVYANYVYANYVYNVSWLSQVQITALSITPLLCCNIWASQ